MRVRRGPSPATARAVVAIGFEVGGAVGQWAPQWAPATARAVVAIGFGVGGADGHRAPRWAPPRLPQPIAPITHGVVGPTWEQFGDLAPFGAILLDRGEDELIFSLSPLFTLGQVANPRLATTPRLGPRRRRGRLGLLPY